MASSASTFDLGALVAACRDLASRAATLISTIYDKGDLSVIEKMYGENRKLTSLRDILNVKDPTTKADELAQKLIVGSLRRAFPGLRVCGEEEDLEYSESHVVDVTTTYDDMEIPSKYRDIDIKDLVVWVDPVDGTKEFTEGIKSAVTTLIGIAWKGRPVAGVIGRPFTKEIIWGIVGFGAFGFQNKEAMSGRDRSSRVICTSRSHFKPAMKAYVSGCKATGFVRAGGSGGKVLMVIEGDADAYVFPSLGTKKWDTCAPEAVLLSLGGKLTKPDGSLYEYDPLRCKAMNTEGFVATVFGDQYHDTFLQRNIEISQLDLVLFGATGFTGQMAVEHMVDAYIYNNSNDEERKLKFGIAGRNIVKLRNLLFDIKSRTKYEDIADEIDNRISIIVCDATDLQSVESMIQKTNVVATTAGPYAKYSEPLIAACCKYGVDYIDLTGEFVWVKRMMNKYDGEARRSHARIINFGGCVSALTDCAIYGGVQHLLNSTDAEVTIDSIQPCIKMGRGAQSSGGTIASWLGMISAGAAHKYDIHNAYFLSDAEDYKQQTMNKQPTHALIHGEYNSDLKKYAAPFLYGAIDRMVICRSNELMNYYYGRKVAVHETLMFFNSQIFAHLFSIISAIIPYLLSFGCLRNCIIRLIQYLSFTPGSGPDIVKDSRYRQLIYISGNCNDGAITCKVDVSVFGDYGYWNTAKLLIEEGVLCATQRNNAKIRNIQGGFLTPAACFKDALPKRLNATRKEFEITYQVNQS